MREIASKLLLHNLERIVHDLVDDDWEENQNETNEDGENHLIPLSLLDTLLPDVVLKTGLFGAAGVSKINNICNESFIDALQSHGVHICHALEGLTHT